MYKPLEFAKNFSLAFISENYKLFTGKDLDIDPTENVEELLDFLISPNFMNPFFTGKYTELNRVLIGTASSIFPHAKDKKHEWVEVISLGATLELWKENKQVYKIDDDFIHELVMTDNIHIPIDIIEQLPYQTFCIDMTENNYFEDIDEIFIHIRKTPNGIILYIFRILGEISWQLEIVFDEHVIETKGGFSYYTYNRNLIPEVPEYLEVSKDIEKKYEGMTVSNKNFDDFCIFIVQLLLYLCATNADIQENPITKTTYKKPKAKYKNKFSEIHQWDVGVRIGNTIRKNKVSRNSNKEKKEVDISQETTERKAVSPHCRRAHWQHYHVGPGRKQTILKWIGITFVNGTKEDIPVTIHKVKN